MVSAVTIGIITDDVSCLTEAHAYIRYISLPRPLSWSISHASMVEQITEISMQTTVDFANLCSVKPLDIFGNKRGFSTVGKTGATCIQWHVVTVVSRKHFFGSPLADTLSKNRELRKLETHTI